MERRLNDFEWMTFWAAIRYFCNRGTIASATYPADIIKNYYPILNDYQKESIVYDLNNELKFNNNFFGHSECDDRAWKKLVGALDKKNHIEVELIDGTIVGRAFEVMGVTYDLETYLKEPNKEIYIPKENIKSKRK
jgi:hypothetical protein